MIDIKRLLDKYHKNKLKHGIFFSCICIFFFAFRDIANNLLIKLILNKKRISVKNILFIEPVKQGYGDLFFQTSLFNFLNNSGYEVSILTNKNHSQVVYNNPDVKNIFFWNLKNILQIFKRNFIVIGLGKDTLRETFLMLFLYKSEKIILDKNIKMWKLIFEDNSNTIAWNALVSKYLEITPNYPKPKIYFSNMEKEIIKKYRSKNKIGIICGVENIKKVFKKIDDIIKIIPQNKKILLLGKGEYKYMGNKKVKDYVNKTSYRDTVVKIATCETIIGTEGSLTQISPSVISKTIVLDINNTFKKNCHPNFLRKTSIITSKNPSIVIQKTLNQI